MAGKKQARVDFGFADVAAAEKDARVGAVFDAVSPYYGAMNDFLSLGAHRWWKRAAASMAAAAGGRALDVAAGSGDVTKLLAARAEEVVCADINAAMLARARRRLAARFDNVRFVRCSAEELPFADGEFCRAVMAFGLRNVTDRARALREMARVLRLSGECLILEFTPPPAADSAAKDFFSTTAGRARRAYLNSALPMAGRLLAGDEKSYRYLAESIQRFPPPETLAAIMKDAGFARVQYHLFAAGGVALHRGWRV